MSNVSQPCVNIVLPTYNRAHLLPAAIASVQAQDFEDWRLIVVDDNSNDNTGELIRGIRARDRRIDYVLNDRYAHSCGGARRRGTDEINGRYVAFLDSDDAWPNYHLSELVAHLEANPDVDWVFGDLARFDLQGNIVVDSKLRQECPWILDFVSERRGKLQIVKTEGIVERLLQEENPAGLQVSLLRSEVFKEVQIRDVFGVEDRLFALECAEAGVRLGFTETCHLRYLVHAGNISGANSGKELQHQLRVQSAVESFWREYVPDALAMTDIRKKIVNRKLADHLVWQVGNGVYRTAGMRMAAAREIWKGICIRPLQYRYWKTLAGALLRG